MKNWEPVKVPKSVPPAFWQCTVNWYSPGGTACGPRSRTAVSMLTSSGTPKDAPFEKPMSLKAWMTYGLLGGKGWFVPPIGPTTSIKAPVEGDGQPPEVFTVTVVWSEPVDGSKVRVPAGPAALATPPRSNAPPEATATTTGIPTNRVKNLLRTI